VYLSHLRKASISGRAGGNSRGGGMKPGIHDMSAESYHGDPCSAPSLSSSIAQLICNESPLHAWTAHPKLNPNAVREHSEAMDLGSICHALVLEGSTAKVHLIQATKKDKKGESTGEIVTDWRTGDAQKERDEARAAGKYPILQCDWPAVEAMYAAARTQLAAMKIDLSEGEAEKTLIWQEDNGVWCRARLDWISRDRKRVLDYKTTGATANPDVVSRTLFSNGYEIQNAFYRRGVKAVFGVDPGFVFAYQETSAPYAMSFVALDPMSEVYAEKRVHDAIETFGECLKSGIWPGYPARVCFAELPGYLEKQLEEKELRELHI
jgi:hypothetical protein